MNRDSLMKFFLWNSVFSIGLILLWTVIFATSADFVYEMHSKLFTVSRENFNAIIYGLIGFFKMLTLTFNIFPLFAMLVINRRSDSSKF